MKSRLCIYPKDISNITGKGLRHSQKLLRNIRFALKKKPHQSVSFKEFAIYMDIELNL